MLIVDCVSVFSRHLTECVLLTLLTFPAHGRLNVNVALNPNVTAPLDHTSYTVCLHAPIIYNGYTEYLQCTTNMPPRRYLVIQTQSTNEQLHFCEVEVFVRRFEWKRKSGYRMNDRVAETITTDRQVHCMNNCTVSPVCDSYNFREADNTCEFNTHATPLEAQSSDIVADDAWGWWSSSFTVVV